jgi:peptidoglycan/LPS O-acetylase OafA/YrhL
MRDSSRFAALDGLRGIAALWVVCFHYLTRYDDFFGRAGNTLFGHLTFPNGLYGVYLFFMISGFVIFMTLLRCRGPLDFIVSRFSRLYPAYWTAVALTASVAALYPLPGQEISLAQMVANATMLQTFVYIADVDGVYWTLAVELSFYAMMLAIFSAGLLRRIERVAWVWLAVAALSQLSSQAGFDLWYRVSLVLVLRYVEFFIAGIVFYLARVEGYTRQRVALLVCCVGLAWLSHGLLPAVALAGFCVLFHLCITYRVRWISTGPILWLGAISYPLYLTHQMLGYRALSALLAHGVPPAVALAVVTAAALALASAITLLVERPAMVAVRRWYRARTDSRTDPAILAAQPTSDRPR